MSFRFWFSAALVLALLHQPALSHVCPPCVCDVLQKRSAGYAISTCAEQAQAALLSTNRTLQLLEVVAAKSSMVAGCRLDEGTLRPLLDNAQNTHIDSVMNAKAIVDDIKNFESSSVAENAAEFDQIMHKKLLDMGNAAFESASDVGKSLGTVLSTCFQETPLPLRDALGVPEVSTVSLEDLSEGPAPSMSDGNIALAWGLTLIAGLSTILGAALVGVVDENNTRLLSFLNSFTAGVMIQGSIAGLGTEALTLAYDNIHPSAAFWIIFLCFFGGAGLCVLLEITVHKIMGDAHDHGPHAAAHQASHTVHCSESRAQLTEVEVVKDVDPENSQGTSSDSVPPMYSEGSTDSLAEEQNPVSTKVAEVDSHTHTKMLSKQSVIVLVAGVTLHNVAEGMATFVAALANKRLGIAVAIAMVLHNVPEGFAIAVPWYHATGSRIQGFLLSGIAGVSEILSAFVVYLAILMMDDISVKQTAFACMFAVAGGMMTFIALHELYPGAVNMTPCRVAPTAGMFAGLACMQLALGGLGIPQ